MSEEQKPGTESLLNQQDQKDLKDDKNLKINESINLNKNKTDNSSNSQSEILNDPRVSFSIAKQKWIFEAEDGQEFEYDTGLNNWIAVSTHEEPVEFQKDYLEIEKQDQEKPTRSKKRKAEDLPGSKTGTDSEGDGVKKTDIQKKLQKHNKVQRKNTAIFISNLPDDATIQEVSDLVSRYGIIAEDLLTGEKKIKFYYDKESGKFKGEALVHYFKEESVQLAIDMLDDSDFRLGKEDTKGKMKVQKADFSYKENLKENNEENNKNFKERSAREKIKIKKRIEKMKNKLTVWDDTDEAIINQNLDKRWNKVVILKNAFTLDELEEDVGAEIDIKQDIREGCEKIGPVTNVILYDLDERGAVSVRFSNVEDAIECVKQMNGRYFGAKKLEAEIYDGVIKYKKRKKNNLEDDENEEDRLKKFGEWLETEKK